MTAAFFVLGNFAYRDLQLLAFVSTIRCVLKVQANTGAGLKCDRLLYFLRAMNVMDLALVWDGDTRVRARLRDHGRLLLECVPGKKFPQTPLESVAVPKSTANARANDFVLGVVLEIMSAAPGLKLPVIDWMVEAVGTLYSFNRVGASSTTTYQDAWAVRRLCQLVKQRLYKPKPPKDSRGR